ncbi:MAG: RNA polymerase sigma factor [Polyangiaceae bacterium]
MVPSLAHGAPASFPWVLAFLADPVREPVSDLDRAMERYADGDDSAFDELYEGLAPRLHGHLLRLTRDPSRADDLLQQTFLRMHGARGRFTPGAEVVPWAFAIARRLFLDSIRRRRFEGPSLDDDSHVGLEPTDDGPSAEDRVAANELVARVDGVLATLPENQRVAYELVQRDGLSIAEAASVVGATVTAMKLRAHRAYTALRDALGGERP